MRPPEALPAVETATRDKGNTAGPSPGSWVEASALPLTRRILEKPLHPVAMASFKVVGLHDLHSHSEPMMV